MNQASHLNATGLKMQDSTDAECESVAKSKAQRKSPSDPSSYQTHKVRQKETKIANKGKYQMLGLQKRSSAVQNYTKLKAKFVGEVAQVEVDDQICWRGQMV
jgi:hypothetical protein